jgi:hypothetical protein
MSDLTKEFDAIRRVAKQWSTGREPVTITRAQHEALMAAAKALPGAQKVIGDVKGRDVWREYDAICNALHTLRAAGIMEEK